MIHLPCDIPGNLRARHTSYVADPARENLLSDLDLKNRDRLNAWRQRAAAHELNRAVSDDVAPPAGEGKPAGGKPIEFNRDVRDGKAPAGSLGTAVGGVLVGWVFGRVIDLIGPE